MFGFGEVEFDLKSLRGDSMINVLRDAGNFSDNSVPTVSRQFYVHIGDREQFI